MEEDSFAPDVLNSGALPDYVDDNEEQDAAGMETEDDEDSPGASEHSSGKKEGHEHLTRKEEAYSLTTKAREYIAKNKGAGMGVTVHRKTTVDQTEHQDETEKRKSDGDPPRLPAPLPVMSLDSQKSNDNREFPPQYFTIRAARVRNRNQINFGENFRFSRGGGGTTGTTLGLGSWWMLPVLLRQITIERI
jgi:hypothetical protein